MNTNIKNVVPSLHFPFLVRQRIFLQGKWSDFMNVKRYQTLMEAENSIPEHDKRVEHWNIHFIVEPIACEKNEISDNEQSWITYYTEILNEQEHCFKCDLYPMGEYCVDCKYYRPCPF